MELIVFRHGPAEDRDPARWANDDKRPLTADGVRETRRAARGLARIVGAVDRIVTSPAARAVATAHLVAEALERTPRVEVSEPIAPGAPATAILDCARDGRKPDARILIVGHEPTLGEAIGLGLTGEAISLIRLTRAGAGALTFTQAVAPGAAVLGWLLTRKQLMALA